MSNKTTEKESSNSKNKTYREETYHESKKTEVIGFSKTTTESKCKSK